MLYVLGGVSRSGKSTIARRLVVEKAIPFFSTDFLVTALEKGVPDLKIRHGQGFVPKAERLWPIVKPLMEHQINKGRSYLIEGDGILPRHVSKLVDSHPNDIKACFIGFTEINHLEKFKQIRNFGIVKNDWTKNISDAELLKSIQNMVDVSKYIKTECQKYNLSYFDCSKHFEENLEKVIKYFTE